jgi:gas vesicle protein
MSDNGSDIGAFMAGFVIGGLVGAATALILAPQSGEETRAKLTTKGQELRSAGEQQFMEYRDVAGSTLADARVKMADTSSQVQDRARIVLDEGKTKVSEAIEKGKERLAQVEEDSLTEEEITEDKSA